MLKLPPVQVDVFDPSLTPTDLPGTAERVDLPPRVVAERSHRGLLVLWAKLGLIQREPAHQPHR